MSGGSTRSPRSGSRPHPSSGSSSGSAGLPVSGPTLAAIQLLAFNEATAERGALLSGVYALGLGIPFIVAALLYRRALGAFAWVRRHQVWVMRAGGLMLVAVGVLLVTGFWNDMVQWLQVHLILGTETPV